MPLPPLRFAPILKSRTWGGRGLSHLGKTSHAGGPASLHSGSPSGSDCPYGESWEVADLAPPVEEGVSRVAGGPFDGQFLTELVRGHRKALLGRAAATRDDRFPLLVKYLDAGEPLSVQVHPTPRYAAAHPGAHAKNEAWVVLHADPGAVIFRGLRPDVRPEAFRAAIRAGTLTDLLVREEVELGDCIPLESGLCHALGAGVVVAEVQTPSDTTFRVYDWDRHDPARPLHVDEAMECILFGAEQGLEAAPIRNLRDTPAAWTDGLRAARLCTNDFFDIEAIESAAAIDAAPMPVATNGVPIVAMLARGEAALVGAGGRRAILRAGDTVLFPADLVPTTLALGRNALLLHVTPADPARRIRDPRPWNERLA